jgi:hypothetical protein
MVVNVSWYCLFVWNDWGRRRRSTRQDSFSSSRFSNQGCHLSQFVLLRRGSGWRCRTAIADLLVMLSAVYRMYGTASNAFCCLLFIVCMELLVMLSAVSLSYVWNWARCIISFTISSLFGCLVAHVFPAIGRETMELLLQIWKGGGRGCDVTTVVGILCKIINQCLEGCITLDNLHAAS